MSGPVTSPTRIGRMKAMDNAAWDEFVSIYGPIVYRLAKKRGLDQEQGAEIFQRVCVKLFQWIPQFDYNPQRGRFRSLILKFAINEIRPFQRQLARGPRATTPEIEENLADAETEQWWESVETSRFLQIALEKLAEELNERDYAVFIALVLAGKKPAAVAEEFQLQRNHVDGIKFKAIRRLRRIAEELRDEWDER